MSKEKRSPQETERQSNQGTGSGQEQAGKKRELQQCFVLGLVERTGLFTVYLHDSSETNAYLLRTARHLKLPNL